MRWRFLCVVFWLFCSWAFSWAQPSPPPSDTSSSSLLSEPVPPQPTKLSERLRGLAMRLEQATIDSESDWELLFQEWTRLSRTLDELATYSADSEKEMQSIKASQEAYAKSLTDSIAREAAGQERERRQGVRIQALEGELWLWRGGTVVGLALAALGFTLAVLK